jgi:hypothetical protein
MKYYQNIKNMKTIIGFLSIMVLASCTNNQMAKSFGGNLTIELPTGQKLVTVTWKDESDIWYLTRPMRSIDTPEIYTLKQIKGKLINIFGDGSVTIIEKK